ncbi:MAG: glutamate ABC transporter substrate-binding protein [Chloroflexi bacterium]|nr:MAG: glutamate ABC transporter substrate-binding protein [Chloroflexota bacterium]
MRGIAGKLSIVLAVVFVAAACGGAPTTSTPTTTASALATTPTFDPMSYMSKLQTNGKIRVGTQEDNTPFSVKNPITSKWEGFDVDVARELAKAIFGSAADPDAFIEYVPVVSATRIPSLTDGKADVIIKTFTITEERKQQIDFSDVYFITGQRILVKKDNTTIKEAADLAGKTVCAQKGSTSEQNMTKATDGKAKPLLLDSYPACLLALQQGQADAVSTDETILFGLVKQDPNTKIVGKPFSDEPYGIGMKKDSGGDRKGFVAFMNTWVGQLISSGTWAKLYEKHITPVSNDKKQTPKG